MTGKGESEAMENGVEEKKRERENGEREEEPWLYITLVLFVMVYNLDL